MLLQCNNYIANSIKPTWDLYMVMQYSKGKLVFYIVNIGCTCTGNVEMGHWDGPMISHSIIWLKCLENINDMFELWR